MRGRSLRWCLVALLATGCGADDASNDGAEIGGSREGCGAPGTHSVPLAEHSCACEPGYDWCDEALDSFECCALDEPGTEDGGEPGPDEPCDESLAEQLLCVPAADDPSPAAAAVWACNGERWVEVPNYSTFACMAEGLEFAYGCAPGPTFLCGFGPGSPCESEGFASVCVNEDIIDTCVWGRRTIDRCTRLCGELGVFGPGFVSGVCEQPMTPDEGPAVCVCE